MKSMLIIKYDIVIYFVYIRKKNTYNWKDKFSEQ